MGIVQDIPEIFYTVIEKSHQGNMSVSAVNKMYYAAGWSVNAGETIIEHPEGNSNFSTVVIILPNDCTAICLLAVILFFSGLRRRKINERQPMTKQRIIVTVILMIVTITLCIICCSLDWSTMLVWQTNSVLTALISSILLTAGITWLYTLTDIMPHPKEAVTKRRPLTALIPTFYLS